MISDFVCNSGNFLSLILLSKISAQRLTPRMPGSGAQAIHSPLRSKSKANLGYIYFKLSPVPKACLVTPKIHRFF